MNSPKVFFPALRLLAAAVLLLAPLPAARAANFFWSDTNGGLFTTGGSWQGGTAPGTTDNAVFVSNASYALQFPGLTVT
ncbi:MAG: hypothetical protein HY301_16090, partial [Verrucomicrobia bacterium]|nr:hypothetical protein [Verrucomicrobiota bacterium]